MNTLLKQNRIRPAIIIGSNNTEQRTTEYTPMDIKVNGRILKSKLSEYAKFVAVNVKNLIDGKYQTLPDRMHIIIAGSSFGGTASLYISYHYPELFGKSACLSLSLMVPMPEGGIYLKESLESGKKSVIY